MMKPAVQPAQDANNPALPSNNAQPAGQTPMLSRYLTAQRPIGPRSSLFLHTIPPFYACYLLKSIQTPHSNNIYIGSTPSPPRRIRQHNGELTAGARKTARKRPWVMQMIVYGFPSRLAALQFEWAWQNPHKSRHLRDENGNLFGTRRSFLMHKNVEIVQGMIARYPFTSWPLHVKLFTEEAVKYWDTAARKSKTPLPPGFICSVELEGVDGKSGLVGSGRVGPMLADDDDFASAIMVKHTALVASGKTPSCSICNEPLHAYATEPLHATLCPTTGCVTTSHLTCLSRHFLTEQEDTPGLVPRGGHCKGCGEYTLWGDVVRGCYRRLPPRDAEQHPDVASDDMFESDEEDDDVLLKPKGWKSATVKKRRKKRASSVTAKRKGKAKALGTVGSGESSSGESFDFDNISSSSEDGVIIPITPKRQPGRPRKVDATTKTTPLPFQLPAESSVTKTRLLKTTARVNTPREPSPPVQPLGSPIRMGNDIGILDMTNLVSSSDLDSPSTPQKKRGRPPKAMVHSTDDQPSPSKKRHLVDNIASSEVDDLDYSNIATNSEGVGAPAATEPKKRGPGRPRKDSGTAAPSPLISRASTKSRSLRLSAANDSPPLSRLYHQQSTSLIPGAPSQSRHARTVHFRPRSPERERGAPGSLDVESPGSFIWDQGRYHGCEDEVAGFQEDGYNDINYGSDSGLMHYSPPRTPERADRREDCRPSGPPSTGGLTRAMAGLSTSNGTPSKVSSSRQLDASRLIWSKRGIPVIEISD